MVNKKLEQVKQKWAKEGRLLKAGEKPKAGEKAKERLPIGQRVVNSMPVLDLGIQPEVSSDSLRLELGVEGNYSVSLSWQELSKLPQAEVVTDIHCVTSWSMYDVGWGGVATSTIVELLAERLGSQRLGSQRLGTKETSKGSATGKASKVLAEAKFVWLTSYDGYTTNIPLADFLGAKCLVATSLGGEAIPRQHGGPVRLVIPHLYFWKSPKWLRKISFNKADKRGFWEERGYHNYGDPWRQQRYSHQE